MRRNLTDPTDQAYFYRYVPEGRMVTLVTVAGLRRPVDEDSQVGEDQIGLDHSQVRLHTALRRHYVLTMAVLAICASPPPRPETPPRPCHRHRPAQTTSHPTTQDSSRSPSPKSNALLNLLIRTWHEPTRHLHWAW